jgi:hypothetical protein
MEISMTKIFESSKPEGREVTRRENALGQFVNNMRGYSRT